ncbi:ATP-dependent DNA helicase DinG [Aquibacillus rhizosphaerae]|uniref:3'-5' exonuclease DinG n=1 Tax=Aquibacillus rhizosphaerae TaxID=3051431 RepID=A0ABT7L6J3_9BACI|nr:ATP-dependent DNA helicase DinG [Aquibacillus sp. LR5S19]MDL4840830.1 ATP-dependent DNA helicase DinG [Aquibacillus sp. LR5S19]
MRKFVVVDLETTGHTPSKGDRIIEIGIVILHEGQIIKEYSSLINPNTDIPSFITNLTGITDSDVKDAPSFKAVANEVIELFTDSYIVAHNIPFDLGFLNYELENVGLKALNQPVLDTVELARILLPQAPGFKLGQLSEYLSLQHDDPHRALSDAYVTAKLLDVLLDKLNRLPYETLHQLQVMEQRLKSDLDGILDKRIEQLTFEPLERDDLEIYRGLALKKEGKHEQDKQVNEILSYGELLDSFFQSNSSLSEVMENYEQRQGQREMSELIFDSFRSSQHALIEAETGTGKSLAYLIPAIYESVTNKERVVVSTHLTQLQTQLLDKEIPVLEQLLPFDFSVALIKGKQHYLSLNKFEKELFSSTQDNYDITLTKTIILIWLTETLTGDIDEIQLPSSGKLFFRRVSTDSEGAIDPRSPWFTRSFYQRVRTKAQKANLIITNHSLLCTDLVSEYQLLPSYQKVIIDEAHHLEATAAKHFGLKLDYINIQFILNSIGSLQEGDWINKLSNNYPCVKETITDYKWDKWWQDTKIEADELFRYLFTYVIDQHKKDVAINDIGRYQYRIDEENEIQSKWNTITEMVTRLSFNLRDLIHILSTIKQDFVKQEVEDEIDEIQSMIGRLQMIIDDLEQLFLQPDHSQVKWVEIEAYGAKNAVYLFCEPVDVSKILYEHLFNEKKSVVLTSATLTMSKSFKFIRERLGLSELSVIEKKIESPYTYDSQVQLMVPNDFPDVKYGKQDDFVYATCEAILSLAEITNGRMLVLFTSYDMLRKSYTLLREIMEQDEFMVIAQGVSSGSRSRLKKNFQAFERAILLGTSSFWEGVDIPGSDLSCIMIVRLPFQPPDHPIYEAKSQHLKENGKNPFMELSLPNAVIRFKQGFGRLIRSSTDRGIVFICDDRIMKARYGKFFIDSIPKVPVSYNNTQKLMQLAEDWL